MEPVRLFWIHFNSGLHTIQPTTDPSDSVREAFARSQAPMVPMAPNEVFIWPHKLVVIIAPTLLCVL
jgi:hypothetical protein